MTLAAAVLRMNPRLPQRGFIAKPEGRAEKQKSAPDSAKTWEGDALPPASAGRRPVPLLPPLL